MKTYNTSYPYFPEEDIPRILLEFEEILRGNKMLSMGQEVKLFEEEFASYIDTKFAAVTNSCTAALETALSALGLHEDDEVIVPVQTFIATASAVVRAGGNVKFCDTDDDFLLDFQSLKDIINPRTRAVIMVHFAGAISSKLFEIKAYLNERGIVLIEDAAHAHGAFLDGLFAGSIGDIGCFSFYSTKIMTTGEGGMVTTNSQVFYDKCASIRNRGVDIHTLGESFINIGSNSRMTEMQAIMGRFQLKRLEDFILYRNRIAAIYKNELKDLEHVGALRFQFVPDGSRHAYWRFILFLAPTFDRNLILQKLGEFGIKADAPYFPLLHRQPVFYRHNSEIYYNAERLSNSHLSLPINLSITESDAFFIAGKLKEVLNG